MDKSQRESVAAKSAPGEDGVRRRSHRRSSTAVRVSTATTILEDPLKNEADREPGQGRDSDSSNETEHEVCTRQGANREVLDKAKARLTSPSVLSNLTCVSNKSNESGNSSGSSSTITQASYNRRESGGKSSGKTKRSSKAKPDVLSFLVSGSSEISQESVQKSLQATPPRHSPTLPDSSSPTSSSSVSSGSGSVRSDGSSGEEDNDTDRSSSPERSPERERLTIRTKGIDGASSERSRSYGTPEMPRGSASLPHIPNSVLTPRVHTQAQGHPKHLPRAEKMPLSGYEQLASRLTATRSLERSGPYLRPMYRRFEMLNHRLLLHLQDELSELEEQLHRLDTADTQNRRLQHCIVPASRRTEALSGGELQWHKTDVLGKIGFKLEQYNRVLSSFESTQSLPTPTLADVHEYRGYLATHNPIVEAETRFLDAADDLVCLGRELDHGDFEEDMIATPMPRRDYDDLSSLQSTDHSPLRGTLSALSSEEGDEVTEVASLVIPLRLAFAAAVVIPTLTFSVIPGFMGRMTVVLLVGLGILGALVQARVMPMHASWDFLACAAGYGLVMATLSMVYW
ncbi:hypothetical protein BX600DRAFT_266148 [Xylariales sp. PMI_506]|nr:hypothetical protein BX600DRAFT_266148 [Xylariales sp. PMI_506]